MLELEQYLLEIEELKKSVEEMRWSLDLPRISNEIEELEHKTAEPEFWNNPENSQKIMQRVTALKKKADRFRQIEKKWEDLKTLAELGNEEEDASVVPEVKELFDDVKDGIEALKLETQLSGQYDRNNAILTLHAGAGGTEAQDWVEMLLRMYTRWAEQNGFTINTVDFLPGDEAGIKSVTVFVEGENAYGYLKGEKGIHRLVRISPFDANKRRHTSFASCSVMPEMDETVTVDIDPGDLRIDTYRSSGAGGQHINKTSSAIRITHLPTGVVVTCQNERSQHQNKETAMKILTSKLLELKEQEQKDKVEDIKGEYKEIAWGSQIRSYVFCPYTLVKDHRTNYEEGNVEAVMDGRLDKFIKTYLVWLNNKGNDSKGNEN
ncbi:MAG: peptide chain release factor 2 [Eubacteriales bacterium]|nr:peptide chain release factor 2 [Eubacteriales bacterium]